LAIELAAARMVSMSPLDVRDRLGDRFRLLSGSRRGLERHRTLGRAVQWSFDLLDDGERALLNRCSVFADGFDLAAAVAVSNCLDEYSVLDGLDSLVRKSLVTADLVDGHVRYGMLETIRQFASEQVAVADTADDLRDRHSRYFADQVVVQWTAWNGPDQRRALDWFDAELANLRAAVRWTASRDPVSAATIAAHSAMLGMALERFEPVAWAEELLAMDLSVAEVAQLPRLYTAASLCTFAGRAADALGYVYEAIKLEADFRADPFESSFARTWAAIAHIHAGQPAEAIAIYAEMRGRDRAAHAYGLNGLLLLLAGLGRRDEAVALADEALAAAHRLDNPFFVAYALYAFGLAFIRSDPSKAEDAFTQGLAYATEHRQVLVKASIARDAGRLENARGNLDRSLDMYDLALDLQHGSGNLPNLVGTLASLAVGLDRIGRERAAATLYGATVTSSTSFPVRTTTVEHLRSALGDEVFDSCVAIGVAMGPLEAATYAREQINRVRSERVR
jgi:tetratricopeptide (TPR) repeat protein